jgi:hypothetical protein
MKNLIKNNVLILITTMLLTSCAVEFGYITPGHINEMSDAEYSDARETHASVTYYNNNVYWGWNEGYWWYYGYRHYQPWWYYYQFCPPYEYHTHTHIHINMDNRYIVKNPRKNRINNKKGGFTYTPNVKTRSNIRVNTKSNNVRVNTRSNNVRVNTNKSNINRTNIKTRSNTNRINIKTRSNKVKINRPK